MRKAIAVLLGTLAPVLGFSGSGQAQSSIQVEGAIQAIDCQAQTLVLSSPSASNTVVAAPYTAVLVNSTSVPFCALRRYYGAPAIAWLVASGSEFVATRIDVVAQVAVVPAPPPTVVVEPLPVAGIVLGTIIVAGLVFLLVRDYDGRFYRYPYYGPYHRAYYRPEYRPYRGPYRDAPARWGDLRRDAPTYRDGRNQGRPGYGEFGNHGRDQRGRAPEWTPARQGGPASHSPNWDPRMSPDDRRGNGPRDRQPDRRCGGPERQPCGDHER